MSTLPVVAAVDGSEDSLRALDRALDAARRRGAALRVVHVRQYAARHAPRRATTPGRRPGPGAASAEVRPVAAPGTHSRRTGRKPDVRPVDGAFRPARREHAPPLSASLERGGTPTTPLLDGRTLADAAPAAARAQVETAVEPPATEYVELDGALGALLSGLGTEAELLVLGSRGRGGFRSLLLGSKGLTAARDAECPVVVVPRPGREVDAPEPVEPGPRVVVGLNVDGPDDAALDLAFTEAAVRDARLQVVAAYPWPVQIWSAPAEVVPPAFDQEAIEHETRSLVQGFLAVHRARHPDVRADPYPAPGDAAGHLVAASKDAELVVVGRHRRRLLAPARMLGWVTHAVLLHAASPVAVVPPVPPP